MILPLFINKNNRISMALMCGVAFYICYSIPNHYHLFKPQLLPLTNYDLSTPLMPWTIFIYLSEYFLFVSAYFTFRGEQTRNKYVWAYLGTMLFSTVFFVFWPVTYPRDSYPLPHNLDWWTHTAFQCLRMVDDPSNSFPSLHVSCCFLTAFSFLQKPESRKNFWIYFIWSFFIALSTLTTKQHYLVDVFAGGFVAVAGYYVFFKYTKYVDTREFIRRMQFMGARFLL